MVTEKCGIYAISLPHVSQVPLLWIHAKLGAGKTVLRI